MSADELRDELDRLQEIVREQGETIKKQNERIDELESEDENDEKEAQDLIEVRTDDEDDLTLRDVWIAGLPFGRILDQIETKIDGPGRIKEYGRGGEPAVVRSRCDVIYARESGPDPTPA